MVRSCQCSSEVAISISKSDHRVDTGLTREVENGKGSLGTRGNLLCGCRNDDRIRACRATNGARHSGIGVPTHHKRTVTLRPPRALARAGFELRYGKRGRGRGGGVRAVFVSPMRACRVWLASVARAVKSLSRPLTRFADDGCLKMTKNAAERAIRPIALGGKNYFCWFRRRRAACGDHLHPHRDRQLNDADGVLSSSPSREAFENDSWPSDRSFISRVRFHALESHAGGRRARKQTSAGVA
jgi:Transposase IS66 family